MQPVIRALADLLLLTGARTTHRVAMPIILAYQFYKSDVTLKYWSFSGPQMVYKLTLFTKTKNFSMKLNASSSHLQEMLLQGIFWRPLLTRRVGHSDPRSEIHFKGREPMPQ